MSEAKKSPSELLIERSRAIFRIASEVDGPTPISSPRLRKAFDDVLHDVVEEIQKWDGTPSRQDDPINGIIVDIHGLRILLEIHAPSSDEMSSIVAKVLDLEVPIISNMEKHQGKIPAEFRNGLIASVKSDFESIRQLICRKKT